MQRGKVRPNSESSDWEQEDFVHQLIVMGETMMISGAEVSRVEDTLSRMGYAYGAQEMNVFVITSCLIITMIMGDGRKITETKRLNKAAETDFAKVEELNALSRRYCKEPYPVEKLKAEVETVKKGKPGPLCLYGGSVLAAASFALFFGGSLWDGAAAGIGAVFICFSRKYLSAISPNPVVLQVLSSTAIGAVLGAFSLCFPALHLDKVMIGDIMLLIPGIAMTNSVRDVLVGDTISGMMRLVETILWAGALAVGFMVSAWIAGG